MKTTTIILIILTIGQGLNTYIATLNGMGGYDCFNFLCLGWAMGLTFSSIISKD